MSKFILYPVGKPHERTVIRSVLIGHRNKKNRVLPFEPIMTSVSDPLLRPFLNEDKPAKKVR